MEYLALAYVLQVASQVVREELASPLLRRSLQALVSQKLVQVEAEDATPPEEGVAVLV